MTGLEDRLQSRARADGVARAARLEEAALAIIEAPVFADAALAATDIEGMQAGEMREIATRSDEATSSSVSTARRVSSSGWGVRPARSRASSTRRRPPHLLRDWRRVAPFSRRHSRCSFPAAIQEAVPIASSAVGPPTTRPPT
jgi:hypothetical protein